MFYAISVIAKVLVLAIMSVGIGPSVFQVLGVH
jgi:hypothetical protein